MGRKPSKDQTPEQAARAAYMREYYRRPGVAEKAKAHAKRYAQNNPEDAARRAKYREDHKEEALEAHRRWRATPEGRAKHAAHGAAWRKRNPEKSRALVHRRRARLKEAFVEDVSEFRLWLKATGRCALCGEPLALADVSVDHIIPLAKGGAHSHANTQATHLVCNAQKGDR